MNTFDNKQLWFFERSSNCAFKSKTHPWFSIDAFLATHVLQWSSSCKTKLMTATWRVQTKCNAISYCCHWLHAFSTLGVDPATTVQFKLYSDRGMKQFEFFQFWRNVCLQRMKWLVSGLRASSLIHRGHSFKLHGSKTKTIRHLHISHNAPYLPPKILHKHCFQ